MHGRPRVTVKAEGSAAGQQKAAESNKKALRLRALQEKVLTWHQQNVFSPEALAASAALLEQNPDVYVTWNYRKKAFVHRCGALEAGKDGSRERKAVQRGAEVKEGEKEAQGKEGQGKEGHGEGWKEVEGEGGLGEGKVGTVGAMGEVVSAGGRDGSGEESAVGGENDGKQGEDQERLQREKEERVRREEEKAREEERKIEEAKGKLADEELKLIEAALQANPKCYGAWHHRKWLFALSSSEPLPSLGASLGPSLQQVRINLRTEARIAREQKLLGMMLSADDRNFHAWDYWRFISHVARMSPAKDLAFTMERINANFSNYSAWHSRSLLTLPFPFSFSTAPHSKLLPKLHSCQTPSEAGGLPQAALEEECELVRQAFFTEPDDQSGWMYQHWLLQQILPPLPPRLLTSWPSPGSTVCFSTPENPPEKSPGGDSAAVGAVSEASAGAAGQVRMSAVLVFSEPVVGVTRESVTLTGAGLEVGEWRAVGGEEAWLSSRVGGKQAGYGREAGCNVGSESASVWTAQVVCSASHDINAAATATATATDAAAPAAPAAAAADGRESGAGESEQWRVDVVQREIDMCRELIDLEPDSKWALLSLARLLSTRRQLHHLLPNLPMQVRKDAEAREEVRSLLRRLVGIDPYHKEYYRDLLEKLEGEEVRRVCARMSRVCVWEEGG
ncbi:unnamed protein product [Closterium sp. Yama58-4]|nr:unnamed protein product [Closterium sp. Yama58-4]